MQDSQWSRRRFLAGLGCASLGSTTLFSSLVHLGAASSASAASLNAKNDPAGDYRALVCILLAGGIDSYNVLVPTTPGEYEEYRGVRADLALDQANLLPLQAQGSAGRSFGLHPSMPEVGTLFDQGELAFVANVGTLVEPVTLSEYEAGTARVPLGLFSHSDQIAQWQTSMPDRRSATGWGGRLADVLGEINSDQRVSMNISLGGTNVFQAGTRTAEFSVTPQGAVALEGHGGPDLFAQLQTTGVNSLMNQRYRNLFETAYADRFRGAMDANRFFGEALTAAPEITTPFGEGELAQSFRMVAQTIAAREQLGHRRQTFFLLFGGWDHHDEVLNSQQMMLPILSQALGNFQTAMVELGVNDQVTTFTTSDFGRTLTSNGRGSDHGWGGNQIVLGGAVRGGRIYGDYPRLFAGNSLDTGRGRLIPTTSVDEYFAELALWLGVDPSALDQVLPNIGRFYSPSSTTAPIGFLQA